MRHLGEVTKAEEATEEEAEAATRTKATAGHSTRAMGAEPKEEPKAEAKAGKADKAKVAKAREARANGTKAEEEAKDTEETITTGTGHQTTTILRLTTTEAHLTSLRCHLPVGPLREAGEETTSRDDSGPLRKLHQHHRQA